jgi:hypothetical protein
MHVGIGGYSPGAEDDPFVILGAVLDQPFLPGPINKDRREDLQLWSLLQALAAAGAVRHPLGVRSGEDPPDRYLVHGSRAWGTELTELTVQDVRRDFAPVRRFGRALQERVRARASEFPHLPGRTVTLAKLADQPMPRDHGQLLGDLEAVLAEDKGFVGEGLDLSQGPPAQLGTRGIYGDHGPFNVIVNPGIGGSSEIVISAASQSQIYMSEAIAALGSRIAAKDTESNEVLVITCGLVDEYGYTCPADQSMFQLLQEALQKGTSVLPQKPTHIRGILVHLWNTPFVAHWETSEDLPWVAPGLV